MLSILRNLFLILIFLFQISLVVCITLSILKKNTLSQSLVNFHIMSLISLIFFEGTILLEDKTLATIFQGLYYASLDWFLLSFLMYVMALSGKKSVQKKGMCYRIVYIVFIIIDSVILSQNFLNDWAFELSPLFVNDHFYCWLTTFHFYYYLHLGLCYLIIAVIFVEIIYRIRSISNMYRFKYFFILGAFFLVLIMNALFMIFMPVIKIDYSVLVFCLLTVIIFVFSLYKIPKKLENELLGFVSQNISNQVICFNNVGECIYKNFKAEEFLKTPGIMEWCKEIADKDLDISIKKEPVRILNNLGEYEDRIFNIEYKWIRSKKNEVIGSCIILEDITVEVENTRREEYRAQRDELTGLYNRSSFFEKCEAIIKNNPDEERYIVCTNISQFKVLNNLFGIKFGDEVLKKQAQMLSLIEKYPDSVVARMSGDKFAFMIRKCDFDPAKAVKNSDIMGSFFRDKNYKLIINIGVYEIVNPYETVSIMYDKAVLALKSMNGDFSKNVNFYDSSLMTNILSEKNILNDFQQALDANQIMMFLQAQVDAKTGKCVGAEALARWSHIERGLLNPDKFVSVLEEAGLVYQLDYYIWKKAVQKLSEWARKGVDFYISVNISPKDFYYADLYKELTELVEFYHVSPSKVNLEITETILMESNSIHKKTLKRLQDYGFNIEMDDFGSGFSSFKTLLDIRMNVLKIDKEFLHESDRSERSFRILTSVIKMAKRMGMTVVIEGVENEKHANFLKETGGDILQGYYYSRPTSVGDFESKFMEVKE